MILFYLTAAVHQDTFLEGCDVVEMAGLRHDVQAWHEQGHEVRCDSLSQQFHLSNACHWVAG